MSGLINMTFRENGEVNRKPQEASKIRCIIRLRRRHRLCLWMNAQNVGEYFMHPSIAASADFAVGG